MNITPNSIQIHGWKINIGFKGVTCRYSEFQTSTDSALMNCKKESEVIKNSRLHSISEIKSYNKTHLSIF